MEFRFLMSAALCADCGNDGESGRAQDAARALLCLTGFNAPLEQIASYYLHPFSAFLAAAQKYCNCYTL